MKSFAWQASINILPKKANKCHRQVLDDLVCEACGMEAKSEGRLFCNCEKTREVWNLTGIPFEAHILVFPRFADLLWHLMFKVGLGCWS